LFREEAMVSRRDVLALVGSAPVLLVGTRADAEPEPQAELEQHESVQEISHYEKTKSGVIFHCTTDQVKAADVTVTMCTPEILRLQMCPDPGLKNVKGLLEIKEDWPSVAFNVIETPEAVSVDTGTLRMEFQRKPWKYVVYDMTSKGTPFFRNM
jgi:hypothetical protein